MIQFQGSASVVAESVRVICVFEAKEQYRLIKLGLGDDFRGGNSVNFYATTDSQIESMLTGVKW